MNTQITLDPKSVNQETSRNSISYVPLYYVIKRNGTREALSIQKIINAIDSAFKANDVEISSSDIYDLAYVALEYAKKHHASLENDNYLISIEKIQDSVELQLMQYFPDIAKAYILYRDTKAKLRAKVDYVGYDVISDHFIDSYRSKPVPWGFDGLGYIVYKRTYARPLANGKTEEWVDTVARCIRGAQHIGADYTPEEAERLFDHVFNLRCCFSGRALWQLGTPTVDLVGADSLLNCWVTKISSVEDFVFIITESMLGGGVGPVITHDYISQLPPVKSNVHVTYKNTNDADFIVPDSKEGWADLWRKILEAYLITGKSFSFSTVCIRAQGEPLKTFGGIAPGPKPLIEGALELIRILEEYSGKKVDTKAVASKICIGGHMVKSGGIRRTSLILQAECNNSQYLRLKRWDLGIVPGYMATSNNSVLCDDYLDLIDEFWGGYNGDGEPYGLLNVPLARKYGRLGEDIFANFILTDNSIIGFNPCSEATLADKECCNLAELALNNLKSKEQMIDCAKLLYKTMKAIAAMEYLHAETNKIVHKNMRLGLGVTGVYQVVNSIDLNDWLNSTYCELRKFDKQYSALKGHNQSIRLSVVKPSGTLSLLLGSTPGCHPGYSSYMFRTVRFASIDPLVNTLREAGYRMEPEKLLDGRTNHDIMVVYFPCKFSKDTVVSEQLSAIEHLEMVKRLQTYWADQAVSVTVYYKKEELDGIKEWLKNNYKDSVKSVSFLLHSGHNFEQAPLSPITREQYNDEVSRLKSIVGHSNSAFNSQLSMDIDVGECSSGHCPIR